MIIYYFVISLALLFLSCGKAPQDKEDVQIQQKINNEGFFAAILYPVNPKFSAKVQGVIRIYRQADEFKVSSSLTYAPQINYTQHLHTGSSCPKIDDDLNFDGYIDSYEAKKSLGGIIVPLDGDLGSQDLGNRKKLFGSYRYLESTSYELLLSDLHLPDPIPNDSLVKLDQENLPLENRVVAIFGRSDVGSIPVACGILGRLSNTPDDDAWEENDLPRRPRIPTRPRPAPDSIPESNPESQEEIQGNSWMERMRQRWRRWRDRFRDRWNGGDSDLLKNKKGTQ